MRNLQKAISRILICFLLPQVLFVGCSLIGLAIGSTASRDDPTDIALLQAGAVRPGSYLLVRKTDNTELSGEFLRISTADEASLTQWYLAAGDLEHTGVLPLQGDSLEFTFGLEGGRLIGRGKCHGLETDVLVLSRAMSLQYTAVILQPRDTPQPGDSLVVTYAVKGGRLIRRCRFRGLEAGALLLSRTTSFPDTSTRIAFDSLGSLHVVGKGDVNLESMRSFILWKSKVETQPDTTTRIAFDDLGTLRVEGKGDVNLASLRHSIEAASQLVLKEGDDTVYVSLGDIASVEVEGSRYAWLKGLAMGAAVDVVLGSLLVNGCKDAKVGGSNNVSCSTGRII